MSVSGLSYDVLVSGLAPVRGDALPNGDPPHWSPLSHTLIHGRQTAALVDPPITRAQTDALGDWIETHGRVLTHICITHWHADHWLGATQLVQRFPEARVFSSPATVERIRAAVADGAVHPLWSALFGDELADNAAQIQIEAAPVDGFDLEGHELIPVETGHSDTDDTTVLHVPSLGLVVAGDVVYNNVHQYLAETPNGGSEAWHQALDIVAGLKPGAVVAGHKDHTRPDRPSDIDETRRYLDDITALLQTAPTRQTFFDETLRRYPGRVNPYTVWLNGLRLLDT
ncbi:MBL fold metallo-hydrolase [Streptomyces sp. NPDC003688]